MAEQKEVLVSDKVLEARVSLLAKDDDGVHLKHVNFEITDPVACGELHDLLAEIALGQQKLDEVPAKDRVTLDTCKDATKFEVTGKKKSDKAA